jgi:hypothetical protein
MSDRLDIDDHPEGVVCLVMCYLGLPPGMMKTIQGAIIQAMWEDVKARQSADMARSDFGSMTTAFKNLHQLGILKIILDFLVNGGFTILGKTISATGVPAVAAIRNALLRKLAAVVSETALSNAFKLVSKLLLYAQIAEIAICAEYCTAITITKNMLFVARISIEAVTEVGSALQTVGNALGQMVGNTLALAFRTYRAHFDPTNQTLSTALTGIAAADIRAITLYLWAKFDTAPDTFLKQTQMTLKDFGVPDSLLASIGQDVHVAALAAMQLDVDLSGDYIGSLVPIELISLFRLFKVIQFKQEPSDLAAQP